MEVDGASNLYQCYHLVDQSLDASGLYTVTEAGGTLAAARAGNCSFVPANADMPADYAATLVPTQTNTHLYGSAEWTLSWEGEGNAVP